MTTANRLRDGKPDLSQIYPIDPAEQGFWRAKAAIAGGRRHLGIRRMASRLAPGLLVRVVGLQGVTPILAGRLGGS